MDQAAGTVRNEHIAIGLLIGSTEHIEHLKAANLIIPAFLDLVHRDGYNQRSPV
ncbi:hypothetical protein D3C75_1347580 [compost metagenome]